MDNQLWGYDESPPHQNLTSASLYPTAGYTQFASQARHFAPPGIPGDIEARTYLHFQTPPRGEARKKLESVEVRISAVIDRLRLSDPIARRCGKDLESSCQLYQRALKELGASAPKGDERLNALSISIADMRDRVREKIEAWEVVRRQIEQDLSLLGVLKGVGFGRSDVEASAPQAYAAFNKTYSEVETHSAKAKLLLDDAQDNQLRPRRDETPSAASGSATHREASSAAMQRARLGLDTTPAQGSTDAPPDTGAHRAAGFEALSLGWNLPQAGAGTQSAAGVVGYRAPQHGGRMDVHTEILRYCELLMNRLWLSERAARACGDAVRDSRRKLEDTRARFEACRRENDERLPALSVELLGAKKAVIDHTSRWHLTAEQILKDLADLQTLRQMSASWPAELHERSAAACRIADRICLEVDTQCMKARWMLHDDWSFRFENGKDSFAAHVLASPAAPSAAAFPEVIRQSWQDFAILPARGASEPMGGVGREPS